MSWFEKLMGFPEESPEQVRLNCSIEEDGQILRSKVNGERFRVGEFGMPSLEELRTRTETITGDGRLSLRKTVGNVQAFHQQPENRGALFQVASQFNLLEMISPSVTPEHGVGIYERDGTQGPACAIAAGAGTIYRNYFIPLDEQVGQSAGHQIDCLAGIGEMLGNEKGQLWRMRNGYALPSPEGLKAASARIAIMDENAKEVLRGKLRVGIHTDTEVTINRCGQPVSQIYGSALPVAYSGIPAGEWEPFARLVLEASYEATLHAALLNARTTGNRMVFLTLLGGGAFGNPGDWIFDAITRALLLFRNHDLDVRIVSYSSPRPEVAYLVDEWSILNP